MWRQTVKCMPDTLMNNLRHNLLGVMTIICFYKNKTELFYESTSPFIQNSLPDYTTDVVAIWTHFPATGCLLLFGLLYHLFNYMCWLQTTTSLYLGSSVPSREVQASSDLKLLSSTWSDNLWVLNTNLLPNWCFFTCPREQHRSIKAGEKLQVKGRAQDITVHGQQELNTLW